MTLLSLPDLYALDRLDLSAETTVDTAAQARVTAVLQQLSDPAICAAAGMVGHKLLGGDNPSKLTWSFVLYERGADRNHAAHPRRQPEQAVRHQFRRQAAARLDRQIAHPGDLSRRSSESCTASLSACSRPELTRIAGSRGRPADRMGGATIWRRPPTAACSRCSTRRCSAPIRARPGRFFTGGGMQGFGNFDSMEGFGEPTVDRAFEHSINLSFVRILRDIVNYYTARRTASTRQAAAGRADDPEREAYLRRFADADGRRFLCRFYKDLRGLERRGGDGLCCCSARGHAAKRLAAVYLTFHPRGAARRFAAFLCRRLPQRRIPDRERALGTVYEPSRPRSCRWPTAAMSRASIRSNCGWWTICSSIPRRALERDHRSQRRGAAGGLCLAVQGQRAQAGHPHPDPDRAGRLRPDLARTGGDTATRSAISCRRSAPRSAPRATGPTRSPS